MTRKQRSIGAGLFAAVALVIGVRHCLRTIRDHGGVGQRGLADSCGPADCMPGRDHDRDLESAAIAA